MLFRSRSCERIIKDNLRKGKTKIIKSKVFKLVNNGNGYLYVTLSKFGKRKNKYVHQLVAYAFLNNSGEVVNHIDFDKTNNVVENLEWCTQKENVRHSLENNRYSRGKIKRSDGVIYNSMTEAAKSNKVVISSIASAIDRKHKSNGYYFEKVI